MKKPVIVRAIKIQDPVLEELSFLDIEMEIDEIPHPVKNLKIVPVKGATVSNFVASTILAVRRAYTDYPQMFTQGTNPESVARIFRDNLVSIMSELSEKGKHVFQAFADTKKGMKMLSEDDLLNQMGSVEEEEEINLNNNFNVSPKKVSKALKYPSERKQKTIESVKKTTKLASDSKLQTVEPRGESIVVPTSTEVIENIEITSYQPTTFNRVKVRGVNNKGRDYIGKKEIVSSITKKRF